jgi:hypothetical protein
MTRLALAAALVAALGPTAGAQQLPTVPPPAPVAAPPGVAVPAPVAAVPDVPGVPVPLPPAVFRPNVYVPPGAQPGPAIPFHKSTGVVVGAYGYYPYDTGNWLLGGTDGQTRQSGSFTMVGSAFVPPGPTFGCRHPHKCR